MCGIAGIFGRDWKPQQLDAMVKIQRHRGPDAEGIYIDPQNLAGLGHNRLSIIDLSAAGRQPMTAFDENLRLIFNGEIYNYLELRRELESEFDFKTQTDTEVLLAAYQKWGTNCLDRLLGMFSFVIWDEKEKVAFGARDRFGVKPLFYHRKPDGTLLISSEIKALHAAGVTAESDEKMWASYLTFGLYNNSDGTFWKNINSLPPGHLFLWKQDDFKIKCWYDLVEKVGHEFDRRTDTEVKDEYLALLKDSVRIRFRADVPIGINLSGGVDSSTLLSLVNLVQGKDNDVKAFTFVTGDSRYDELPWVNQMLEHTNHPAVTCKITAEEIPALAQDVQYHQDEPFGGIPTLAYAKLFEQAKSSGVVVLLDGNGLDEQWAGYDYYHSLNGTQPSLVQGTVGKSVREDCLTEEFRSLAKPQIFPNVFPDKLRNLQYRDTRFTKIPRAVRFNDRISMRSSTELREPFLDHRLFEIALQQPAERKIQNGTHKWLLRQIAHDLTPKGLSEAPKRPLQTPQREWLRGPLRGWASDHIAEALNKYGGTWLDKKNVTETWKAYCLGESDNSFYVWQWISLSLISRPTIINQRTNY